MSDSPFRNGFAITLHDTNPLPKTTRGIYVGAAGDITLRLEKASDDLLFKAVPVGTVLHVRATHVRSTGTGASLLLGLY